MILDLHIHTVAGSNDSGLSFRDLVAEASRIGLDGVCLTEHRPHRPDSEAELGRLARGYNLMLATGLEVETDLGHVVALGLNGYVGGIHSAEKLRQVADEMGAFLIAVHPFRRLFFHREATEAEVDAMVEQKARLPLLRLVDGIEVANGACSDMENLLALKVARRLGKPGTGGSDAHSAHGIGCFVTVFARAVADTAELVTELKAGRFYAGCNLLNGHLEPFG